MYLKTYYIYSPNNPNFFCHSCRSCFLDLALFPLFCGWTTYVSKCSAKNWMLYCVWNLPSTKWDYFTCLTYDTPVYMSQFDICPFCNSMTLLTHVQLLIHCNPRCFLAELLCNQLSPSYIWTADYASVTTLHWFILNCILFFQTVSAICQDHSVLQCCLQRLLPFPLAWYRLQISCKIFSVPPSKTLIKVLDIAGPRTQLQTLFQPDNGPWRYNFGIWFSNLFQPPAVMSSGGYPVAPLRETVMWDSGRSLQNSRYMTSLSTRSVTLSWYEIR